MEHYTIRCSGLSIFIVIHDALGRSMKNVTDSLDEIIKLIRELENKIDKVIEKQDDTWTLKDKSKT
jgi:ArsR family metal-binding transcriptional regulator